MSNKGKIAIFSVFAYLIVDNSMKVRTVLLSRKIGNRKTACKELRFLCKALTFVYLLFSMVNSVIFGIASEKEKLVLKEEDLWNEEAMMTLVPITLNKVYVAQ